MPEPTPTTDVVSELKPGGKQFPKWGYFAIGGAVIIALLIYKSKKSKEEAIFQPAETGGQNLEQQYPVSGGGGIGTFQELQKNNTEFLEKYLNQEKQPAPKAGERGNQPGRNKSGNTETKVHKPGEGHNQGERGKLRKEEEEKQKSKTGEPEKPPIKVEVPQRPPSKQQPPIKREKAPPKLQPIGGGNKPRI